MPTWFVTGHAIVSDDDCIADAQGRMPAVLRNEADWALFQAELDRSDLTVLGRLGHEAHGNPQRRPRMVVSAAVGGLERRADAWWWNPSTVAWPDAASRALPPGGRIAVPGGQGVFDLFLKLGYDAFHLTRAIGVRVPGGRRLFGTAAPSETAESVLARHGLAAGPAQVIDPAGPVILTDWRRG
ncbi:hypothetical protein GCM10007036_17980 [Alsobacter metallidurans]|uniref:Dihydrofolate reductase n=1 Tax=Alsobacter metallidurans TaxID=340221 RepID=A0A917I6L5_9HYPH|nr:hypothetical protein [Alsobacter metallidurans]GGH16924.1 hypothetical protein GCM10007036_17980 [Alsobacter metallidurans]